MIALVLPLVCYALSPQPDVLDMTDPSAAWRKLGLGPEAVYYLETEMWPVPHPKKPLPRKR